MYVVKSISILLSVPASDICNARASGKIRNRQFISVRSGAGWGVEYDSMMCDQYDTSTCIRVLGELLSTALEGLQYSTVQYSYARPVQQYSETVVHVLEYVVLQFMEYCTQYLNSRLSMRHEVMYSSSE